MSDQVNKPHDRDDPQVFAVSKNLGGKWKFNRRDFVKAAGAAASIAAAADALSGSPHDVQAQPGFQQTPKGARAHSNTVHSVDFNPDGSLLVSGANDSLIKLWSMPDGALLRTLEGHESLITVVAFSPDGSLLASGGRDDDIRLWSMPDSTLLDTIPATTGGYDIHSLSFSPDGSLLVSGRAEGEVNLWSIPDGELLKTLNEEPGLRYQPYCAAVTFAPNDAVLAIAMGSAVHLWSVNDNSLLTDKDAHLTSDTGREITIQKLAFSADGSIVAAGGSSWIRLWSVPDMEEWATLKMPSNKITEIAIAPDFDFMVASNLTNKFGLWPLSSQELTQLTGHTGYVAALAFSPDGSLLVSGDGSGVIKLWSMSTGEYLQDLVDLASSLPEFEGVQYSPNDTGTGVITLPCGSPIPTGSTCICNCVQGSGCNCVGHRSSGGGSHYWHPN